AGSSSATQGCGASCYQCSAVRAAPRRPAQVGKTADCADTRTGQDARLALQLELCLPRLLSSPVPGGSIDGLRAFSRNSGRRARPTRLLPFFTSGGAFSPASTTWPV